MVRVLPRVACVAVILLAATLAGCLGSQTDPQPAGQGDEGDGDEPGMVSLTVLDPGQVPFQGATVNMTSEHGAVGSQVTNVLGIARFEELRPGNVSLMVDADRFQYGWVNFTLAPGQHAQGELILVRDEPVAFVEIHTFEGLFECSATYLIITGECDTVVHFLYDNVTGESFPINVTESRNVFPFEVGPDWVEVRVVQEWDESELGFGAMMRVNLEPAETFEIVEYDDRFARTEGESPIAMSVYPGVLHENASSDEVIAPIEGGMFQTRSYHMGLADLHDLGGSGFLGFGGAYQQRFTVHVEIHYERL